MKCKYCSPDSCECTIFIDPQANEYYYDHQTNEWDICSDDFVHERIYISYCPWCGSKLDKLDKNMEE